MFSCAGPLFQPGLCVSAAAVIALQMSSAEKNGPGLDLSESIPIHNELESHSVTTVLSGNSDEKRKKN